MREHHNLLCKEMPVPVVSNPATVSQAVTDQDYDPRTGREETEQSPLVPVLP